MGLRTSTEKVGDTTQFGPQCHHNLAPAQAGCASVPVSNNVKQRRQSVIVFIREVDRLGYLAQSVLARGSLLPAK